MIKITPASLKLAKNGFNVQLQWEINNWNSRLGNSQLHSDEYSLHLGLEGKLHIPSKTGSTLDDNKLSVVNNFTINTKISLSNVKYLHIFHCISLALNQS